MHLFNEPTAVGGGFQPLAPLVDKPGFETPPYDNTNITFMGDAALPAEQEAIGDAVREAGLVQPIGEEAFVVVIVPPEILSEVIRMNDAHNDGVPLAEIRAQASPEARAYFDTMAHQYDQGKNVIVTDKDVSFGLQLFPGKYAGFFITRGVN